MINSPWRNPPSKWVIRVGVLAHACPPSVACRCSLPCLSPLTSCKPEAHLKPELHGLDGPLSVRCGLFLSQQPSPGQVRWTGDMATEDHGELWWHSSEWPIYFLPNCESPQVGCAAKSEIFCLCVIIWLHYYIHIGDDPYHHPSVINCFTI